LSASEGLEYGRKAAALRLVDRALRLDWPIPPESYPAIVADALDVMAKAPCVRDRLTALNALLRMNAQRILLLRTELQQETADKTASASLARAALATPEGRKALSALSQTQAQPQPALPDPPPESPPIQ
jgi:hypothetical protein